PQGAGFPHDLLGTAALLPGWDGGTVSDALARFCPLVAFYDFSPGMDGNADTDASLGDSRIVGALCKGRKPHLQEHPDYGTDHGEEHGELVGDYGGRIGGDDRLVAGLHRVDPGGAR